MAKLSDFYPYVLPDVPACPEITADVALSASLIEFCEKSLIVQRNHDPITVILNTTDYDLEPPTGQLVVKVMRAWYKNTKLEPIAPDNVEAATVYNTLFSEASVTKAEPRQFLQKDERTITVYPVPKETVANALTLRVALKPTRKATTFDDVLFEDYAEGVAYGAKYRLLSMSNKPWTNGPAAANSLTLFNAAVNVARSRAARGNTRGNVRVTLTGV
jgi:hypothetical protein